MLTKKLFNSEAYCPDETTSTVHGEYMWNTIAAEGTVTRTCMFGGVGTRECVILESTEFTRQCNNTGEWGEPDFSRCYPNATRRICDIRNVSIDCVALSY